MSGTAPASPSSRVDAKPTRQPAPSAEEMFAGSQPLPAQSARASRYPEPSPLATNPSPVAAKPDLGAPPANYRGGSVAPPSPPTPASNAPLGAVAGLPANPTSAATLPSEPTVPSTPTPTPGLANTPGTGRPGERLLEGPQSPSVTIQKLAPEEIQVGRRCTFAIRVQNTGQRTAQNVQIHDEIPLGTELVGTAPRASVSGAQVVWDIGTLSVGEERTVEMEVIPTEEGELGSVASVTFATQASAKGALHSSRTGFASVQQAPGARWPAAARAGGNHESRQRRSDRRDAAGKCSRRREPRSGAGIGV